MPWSSASWPPSQVAPGAFADISSETHILHLHAQGCSACMLDASSCEGEARAVNAWSGRPVPEVKALQGAAFQ